MAQDSIDQTNVQLAQLETAAQEAIERLKRDLLDLQEQRGEECNAQTIVQVERCLDSQKEQLRRIHEIRAGLREAVDSNKVVRCIECDGVIPAARVASLVARDVQEMRCLACQEAIDLVALRKQRHKKPSRR